MSFGNNARTSSTTATDLLPNQSVADSPSYYDPDDAAPSGSPQMNPIKLNRAPSPSPPPVNFHPVSLTPAAQESKQAKYVSTNISLQVEPNRGNAVLITYLSNGRRSDLASDPSDNDRSPSCSPSSSSFSRPSHTFPMPGTSQAQRQPAPQPLDLKILAAGALAFSSGQESTENLDRGAGTSASLAAKGGCSKEQRLIENGQAAYPGAREGPRRPGQEEDRLVLASPATVVPAQDSNAPHRVGPYSSHVEVASPTSPLQPASGGLPPLQIDSPKSDTSGQALPSIRQHFSDLALSSDPELPRPRNASSFSRSPPASLPGISSINLTGATSPTSPGDSIRRDFPSPQSMSGVGYNFHTYNSHQRLPGGDHSSSTVDTPSSDQSSTTPTTTTADRISIDGLTTPQSGGYICTFSGCTAAPFQTQYLLNSHANVHSSARPHYCPVKGCPRSEGGKGFKRKNEMIRHGLVHESPGYVCPFCPDREHKYPRPDNLQRHVRVHHVDKDKDDPLLRDVLAQRPDGPNRGRRRRGAPS